MKLSKPIHPYSIFPLGDQAVSLQFGGQLIDPEIHAILISMKSWIDQQAFAGLSDVVVAYRSITLHFDLVTVRKVNAGDSAFRVVERWLTEAYEDRDNSGREINQRHIRIPVCYNEKFGPDIPYLCERNKLTAEKVIQLHTSTEYAVYLVGFLPGFPYLGCVDPKLEAPRKQTPRSLVEAGSVGVAGKQTGIYPFDSPGGWQIIGRTPLRLFDATNSSPALLEVGDKVSFFAIDENEFWEIKNSFSR